MSTVNLVLANPLSSQPVTLILGSSVPLFEGNQTTTSVGSLGISVSAEVQLTGTQSNTEVNNTPLGYFVPLSTAATAGLGTDVYWGNVQLLIHADDEGPTTSNINNSTNLVFVDPTSQDTNLVFEGTPSIVDSSPFNKTIVTSGDTIVRPDNFKFGSYSMLFDGVGDYLYIPNEAILKDTIDDDWTIECWIYPSNVTTKQVLFASGDTEIYISNGMIAIDNGLTGSAASLQINVWQHIAVSCSGGVNGSGGTIKCYINGVSGTPAAELQNTRTIDFIGCSSTNTNYYTGWMDEVRITAGVARYFTNFTAPPEPFPEGYADGGATQVNCFIGAVDTNQTFAIPVYLSGVESISSIYGDLEESMYFALNGTNVIAIGEINSITTSQESSQALTGVSSTFSAGNLGKNISFGIGGSLFPKTQFADSYSTPFDSNYSNVYLLLHAEGGSIVDSGPLNTTVTNTNSVQISTVQKRYGDSSLYFNKSNYLTVPGLSSGAGPITIEFSVNLTSAPTSQKTLFKIGGDNNPYWYIWITINTDRTVSFIANLNGLYSYTTSAMTLGTWYDIAVSYNAASSGSAIRGFFNGSYVWGQGIVNNIFLNNTGGIYIGYSPGETIGTLFNGYIDELRITKSVNRYTAGYTPEPFADTASGTILDQYYSNVKYLIHANGSNGSTTLVDNSSNPKTTTAYGNAQISTTQSKFGGSSIYFDGFGDYTQTNASTDFNVGSGDFTIEAWVNTEAFTQANPHFITFTDGSGNNEIRLTTDSSTKRVGGVIYHTGAYRVSVWGTTVMAINTWYHVAFVRSGTKHMIFVNGVLENTSDVSHTWTYSNPIVCLGTVGGFAGNGYLHRGWIDDARITIGIARYTSNDTGIVGIAQPLAYTAQSAALVGNTSSGVVGTITASVQAASIVAFGQVGTLKYERAYEINGNELTCNTGNPTLSGLYGETILTSVGTVTDSLTENYANNVYTNGQVGTLKYERAYEINGNQTNTNVGNIFGSITVGISSVICTTEIGTPNYTLTDNYGSGVIATGQVGTLKYERAYEINGNQTNVLQNSFYPNEFRSLVGNTTSGEVGEITPTKTADYAGQVSTTGQVGTITTSNIQEKSIIGFGSNTAVGSVSPRNTMFLSGVESTTIVNSVSTALTENFARGNQITCSVGSLTKKSDGLVQLIGNQATVSDGLILQIKYTALVGNLITGNIRSITPQQSLNVTCFTSVGNITTSVESTRSITGNISSAAVGDIKTDRFVALTSVFLNGSVDAITATKTADYASQASTTCQVGSISVTSVRELSITGVQAICTAPGILGPTQTVNLTGNLIPITIANITPAITANFLRGVSSSSSIGTVRAIKEYFPTGNQINTAAGNIFAGPVYYRQLSGNVTYGKLYEDAQPDTNVIGTHGETYLPGSYSIKVRGINSLITDFKCVNSNSPLIEVYFNGVDAWVKLNTPGSFENYNAYYITEDGEYGIASDPSLIPPGAEIYNIEQEKQTELRFEMTGVYDDGANPQPFKRTYIINIIIDYSTERDLVGLGVL